MKKIIILISGLFFCFSLFCQTSVNSLSMVSFKSSLTYTEGEDVLSNCVQRELKPFSINKYETSYGLWYEVRTKAEKLGYYFQNPGQGGSNGRRGAAPTEENKFQPVTMINWYDCIVWLNALSEIKGVKPCYTYEGKVLRDSSETASCDLCECDFESDGYRLPCEAEWEYASRRTKDGFQKGNLVSGQDTSDSEEGLLFAWTSENSNGTRIIGTAGVAFDPNSISSPSSGNPNHAGLFDMSGNVLEFCWDWMSDYSKEELYGKKFGYERVSRGGSWSEYTMFDYCADRYSFDPNECYNYMGFRICKSIIEEHKVWTYKLQ